MRYLGCGSKSIRWSEFTLCITTSALNFLCFYRNGFDHRKHTVVLCSQSNKRWEIVFIVCLCIFIPTVFNQKYFPTANLAPTIPEQRPHVCEDTPLGAETFTASVSKNVLTHLNSPVFFFFFLGKPAFNILATDPEKDPLTYAISGSDASYFKVEPSNGTVYVEKILDREVGWHVHHRHVFLRDWSLGILNHVVHFVSTQHL